MTELVTYRSENRIALITINRPDKMNALSNAVVAGLKEAFRRLQDGEDRVAILTGAGERAFSAGADLRDPPRDPELWECMPGVGLDVDKPIIAAVAGHCVGGAYCLVQFCDIAVAAENAIFSYPEAQLGFSGGLIAGLAARLPHKIAMEFMLAGTRFDAKRAYEVGMVNKVVPTGQHIEGAMEYARILVDSAPIVMGVLKGFVRDSVVNRGPSELQGIARRELFRINKGEDRDEGAAAYREKRKPVFKGR